MGCAPSGRAPVRGRSKHRGQLVTRPRFADAVIARVDRQRRRERDALGLPSRAPTELDRLVADPGDEDPTDGDVGMTKEK